MKYCLLTALLFTINFSYSETESDSLTYPPEDSAIAAKYAGLDSIIQHMNFRKGEVSLPGDLATIKVPEGFSFLDGKDAQFILTDIWGNPEDKTISGMMVPDDVSLLEGTSWVVIYSYEEDGHVKDDDAEDIDYTDLLGDMKKSALEANSERAKSGYPSIEIIGWAQTPYYDKESHKLHWAKEIKFGTDSIHTLNYNIRMLGRKGVLVLNVIAGMDQLPLVNNNVKKILASTEFTKGNKYDDFNSSMDKVAEYGIGGLIAGGILAKTGILAKLGLLLIKLWKVIAIAVVGAVAFIRKKFTGKKAENELRQSSNDTLARKDGE
ncbi:MAG: DUF2167 domain-containing protein [Bacteroidota bacterium]